jgi:hypothetical protein
MTQTLASAVLLHWLFAPLHKATEATKPASVQNQGLSADW